MSDVRVAVLSHLHEDHIGGIRELPARWSIRGVAGGKGDDGTAVSDQGAPLLLMVWDLTYEVELLDAGRIPGVGNRALRRASAMVGELRRRHPEPVVLPAHDPGASGRLARATGQAPAVVAG